MIRRLIAVPSLIVLALALAAPAGAASFEYPDFSSTSGLTLTGDAKQAGSVLRLTEAEFNKAGRAFATAPIDPQQSFESRFALSIHDLSCCDVRPGDGIAFLIQSDGLDAGEGIGGSLGYGGIAPSLAIEFDVFYNPGSDPNAHHIAIVTEGDLDTNLACASESAPIEPCTGSLPFTLYGAPFHAWVDYDAPAQRLRIYASQGATKPASPLLDEAVSMAPLGSSAHVGFTAATGAHTAVHDVLSWSFGDPAAAPTVAVPSPAPATQGKKKRKRPCKRRGKRGKGKGKGTKKRAAASRKKGKRKKPRCRGKKGKGKGKGAKKG